MKKKKQKKPLKYNFTSTPTTCKNCSFILLLSMVLLYNISKNKNQEKTVEKKKNQKCIVIENQT